MRRTILAAVLGVALAGGAAADDRSDITGIIQSQIEAFLADDFATAFTFASPSIKQMFGTSERFGTMVRQGYPMVWRPADVTYLETEPLGSNAYLQRVLITDAAGVPHLLEYQMIATPEGWQINGVRILRAPQVGA